MERTSPPMLQLRALGFAAYLLMPLAARALPDNIPLPGSARGEDWTVCADGGVFIVAPPRGHGAGVIYSALFLELEGALFDYDLRTTQPPRQSAVSFADPGRKVHRNFVRSAASSPDGGSLWVGDEDGDIVHTGFSSAQPRLVSRTELPSSEPAALQCADNCRFALAQPLSGGAAAIILGKTGAITGMRPAADIRSLVPVGCGRIAIFRGAPWYTHELIVDELMRPLLRLQTSGGMILFGFRGGVEKPPRNIETLPAHAAPDHHPGVGFPLQSAADLHLTLRPPGARATAIASQRVLHQ